MASIAVVALIAIASVSGQPGKPSSPAKPGNQKGTEPKSKLPKLPPAASTKDDGTKWSTIVNGKDLKQTVKDIRHHPDPAVREASIRALPFFGPIGRAEGADDLVEAMTKDLDWNVRLAAIDVAPTELLGFAKVADFMLAKGLNAIYSMLSYSQYQARMAAIVAIGNVGPYMRLAEPRVISSLSSLAARSKVLAYAASGGGSAGTNCRRSPEPGRPRYEGSAGYKRRQDVDRSLEQRSVRGRPP